MFSKVELLEKATELIKGPFTVSEVCVKMRNISVKHALTYNEAMQLLKIIPGVQVIGKRSVISSNGSGIVNLYSKQ